MVYTSCTGCGTKAPISTSTTGNTARRSAVQDKAEDRKEDAEEDFQQRDIAHDEVSKKLKGSTCTWANARGLAKINGQDDYPYDISHLLVHCPAGARRRRPPCAVGGPAVCRGSLLPSAAASPL